MSLILRLIFLNLDFPFRSCFDFCLLETHATNGCIELCDLGVKQGKCLSLYSFLWEDYVFEMELWQYYQIMQTWRVHGELTIFQLNFNFILDTISFRTVLCNCKIFLENVRKRVCLIVKKMFLWLPMIFTNYNHKF